MTLQHFQPRAAMLLKLLSGLNIEGFEKSFKMTKHILLEKRFLIGIDQVNRQQSNIFNHCHVLGMHKEQLQSFKSHLPKANRAYFGYEETDNRCTLKVYLEFWNQYAQKRAIDSSYKKPFPLYIGYKWNALNNTENTQTNYTLYPEISLQEILERIKNIYQDQLDSHSSIIAQQIINYAAEKTKASLLKYLEVTEDKNTRKSFDINLYEADLKIHHIHQELKSIQKHYEINPSKFDNFYQSIKHHEFGHISGGIDKSDAEFMTFYYEVNSL